MKKKALLKGYGLFFGTIFLSILGFSQIPNNPDNKPVLGTPLLQRPNSPNDLTVIGRGANFLRLSFSDSSTNEIGNRLIRSIDGVSWTTVIEFGPIRFGGDIIYDDVNLQSNKLYFYRIEVYAFADPNSKNSQVVTSRTPVLGAYTGEADVVKLFRLQLRIRTSTISTADMDGPLRIDIGINRGKVFPFPASIYTFLDSGHDDFEKGDSYSYELNLGDISSLAELGDITISNTTFQDNHIIDSILVIANNTIVFEKSYRPSGGFNLQPLAKIRLPFNEMAVSAKWQQLISAQRGNSLPVGLTIIPYDAAASTFAVKIPKSELISRIEGIVGHLITAEPRIRDNAGWDVGWYAVEVSYKKPDTLHVDLDLETRIGSRELDVDFDLSVSPSCKAGQLVLNVSTTKPIYNSAFDFLNGLTPGINFALKIAYDLVIENESDDEGFTIQVRTTIPENIRCKDIRTEFNQTGDLLIIFALA